MSSKLAKRSSVHWPSVVQFAGSGLGLAFFWTGAAGATVVGLYGLILSPAEPQTATDAFFLAWAAAWVGFLLLPSVVHAFARLSGKPVLKLGYKGHTNILLPFLFPLIYLATLAAGHLTTQIPGLAWIALPPLHILAATLPLGWIVFASIRKLDLGSRQRKWGALATGLILGPALALIFELLLGVALFLVGAIYIGSNPELISNLNELRAIVENSSFSQQDLVQVLGDFLSDPFLYTLVILNFSVFVPIVEEVVKPISVWLLLLLGPLTPAAGFGLGLISGAGFALLENLFSGASLDAWAGTAATRVGATAFHLGTSALMGWGIVRARNERRYAKLAGIYLLSIMLHGAWNAVVVATSLGPGLPAEGSFFPFEITLISGVALFGITVISLGLLAFIRRQVLRAPPAQRGT